MVETSVSLLDRLRQNPDDGSWQRLVDIYTPLIRGWLRRHSLAQQDADDLVQEVLAAVVRKLPQFRRPKQTGSFRSWLRHITVNCLRDHWRSNRSLPVAGRRDYQQVLDEMQDPDSKLSRLWDQEHDHHVTHRLLELIRPRFEPATFRAFQRVALEGASPDQAGRM